MKLRQALVVAPCALVAAHAQMCAAADVVAIAPAPSAAGMFLKVFFALLLIVSFIMGLAWFLRRYQRFGAPTSAMQVVAGVSLGQREKAVVLKVGDVHLVVGVAPGCVRTLHVLETSSLPTASAESVPATSFAARLADSLKQRKKI